jgi:hypothetical protein
LNYRLRAALSHSRRTKCAALCLSALLAFSSAHAELIEGVDLAPRVELGGKKLVLNGAGVRKIILVKVYVAALYLPQKTGDSEAILRAGESSRLEMHLLRNLTAEELANSITKALRQTLTDAERVPLEPQVTSLDATLRALPPLKKGMRFSIDYAPESGTTLTLDGESRGVNPHADFNSALLRVWLGSRARDPDLRDALLGLSK